MSPDSRDSTAARRADVDVVAIIQARTGSSRLPGKTLLDLGGYPVVDWVHRRVARAAHVSRVVVATTDLTSDDRLADHLRSRGVDVVRGSSDDVLGRFGAVLETTNARRVVRITADCPFVQPELIDLAIDQCAEVRYVYSGHDNRMPRGFDLEVLDRSALEEAIAQASRPDEREHVTPFIARRPSRFASRMFDPQAWARRGDLRFTVDEPADMEALRAMVEGMQVGPENLNGPELISFCDRHPEITAINADVEHRVVR